MIDFGDIINKHFKNTGMLINHTIHFLAGCIGFRYNYIIPIFIIYQLYDSIDFNNLKTYPKDNLMLDITIFCIGYWFINFIKIEYKKS
tara:strand:- start:38 stop:301 length:264 start_codon:yes stop_codon:yes gene_type:complete